MNATCSRTQELLPQTVLSEMDESRRAELFAHTDVCADCDSALAFYEDLHAAIDAAPLAAPPPVYFESVLAELHQQMPQRPARNHRAIAARSRFRIPRQWFATAVMGCFALMVMPGIFMDRGVREPDGNIGSAMATGRVVASGGVNVSAENNGLGPGSSYAAAPQSRDSARIAHSRVQVAMLWIPEIGYVSASSGLLELGPDGLAELGLSQPVRLEESFMFRRRG